MADQRISETEIKHLEFIQTVIGRQASNSFLIKGWALTVAGIFYGFAANELNWRIALVALLPGVVFWGLDAYYLWQERVFRCLYDAVRTGKPAIDPFCMKAKHHPDLQIDKYLRVAVTKTIWSIYTLILAVGVGILVASWHHYH
jgi:hypothetical protein